MFRLSIGFFIISMAMGSFSIRSESFPIRVGEKLTYVVRWGFIPVGYGILKVKEKIVWDGKPVFHIVAKARSNAFLSAFYPVEDRIDTWIDQESMLPLRFRKILNEGGYHADEEVIFDHYKELAHFHSFRNGSKKIIELNKDAQDALSCLYLFRTWNMVLNKEYTMSVHADEKNWMLKIDVIRNENKLKLGKLGQWRAILVEPKAQYQGIFIRRGKMYVWISSDKRRLPLLMKSKVPFGKVSATLVNIDYVREMKKV